ncbi:hypothetical protein [Aureimonas psammosilenae]|uniref:hypothetical protein n=1 Tax=Aureimonas psammosilenae TaxID=2495496 RepID=UPI0012608422|nr:hypothetical protein [Aureimonas psammosilenae]
MASDFDDRNKVGSTSTDSSSDTSRARLHDDGHRVGDALNREASDAKSAIAGASEDLRKGAADLASTAKQRLADQAEQGKEQASSSLGDFAAAIRKASDELGQRDQSMAAGLVRELATGIEQAAGSIKGQNLQDISRSVTDFARRQPTTFLIGVALAGVALGRFARATGEHGSQGVSNRNTGQAHRDYGSDRVFSEGHAEDGSLSSATRVTGAGSSTLPRPGDDLADKRDVVGTTTGAGRTPETPYDAPSLATSATTSFGDRNVR